jgi:flagellar hook-associated protein 2
MSGVTGTGTLTSSQITSLIQQASTAYQAPATDLQNQEKPIQAQISALGQVQSALSSLQTALGGLADLQTLAQQSVTSSSKDTVTATATNAAAAGTYSLSNIQLAEAQSLVSTSFASASSSLGAGSITLQVGSGSPTTINIASGQDTLNGIAQAINAAKAGVNAQVVYNGSSYQLSLTAQNTGTANAFTVSGTGGEAGFSYTPGGKSNGLTVSQAAANASFSLNGIPITSSSNTVTNATPGLTFTLTGTGSATVTVTQDVSALDQAADGLVKALNTVITTIDQNSALNQNSSSSSSQNSGPGALLGDVNVQILRDNLVNAFTGLASGAAANSPYNSLSSVGFSISSDGTISLNDQQFEAAAQANYGAVASLLGGFAVSNNSNVSVQDVGSAQPGAYAINVTANSSGSIAGTVNGEAANGTDGNLVVSGAGPAQGLSLQVAAGATGALGQVTVSQGVYGTLNSLVNAALSNSGGGVTGEINSLNNTITSMNQQISQLQKEANQQTALLTQQYTNAESTISQLSTVSEYLTSYLDQLNNTSSSSSSSGG